MTTASQKLWKYTWTGTEPDLSIIDAMIRHCEQCERRFQWAIEDVKGARHLVVTTPYEEPGARKRMIATIARVAPNTTIEVDADGVIILTIPSPMPVKKTHPVEPPFHISQSTVTSL